MVLIDKLGTNLTRLAHSACKQIDCFESLRSLPMLQAYADLNLIANEIAEEEKKSTDTKVINKLPDCISVMLV